MQHERGKSGRRRRGKTEKEQQRKEREKCEEELMLMLREIQSFLRRGCG